MPDTGWKPATTGVVVATGALIWNNPSNAADNDLGTLAQTPSAKVANTSHSLVLTGYGFSIPMDQVIVGIEVDLRKQWTSGGNAPSDHSIRLVVGGVEVGNNEAVGGAWPSSLTSEVYGGVANLWGLTPSVAQVNSSDFGVAIRVNFQVQGRANVAEAYIRVHYAPANTPPTITVNPSVNYNGYTRLGPSNTPGTVSFTATDPEETGSNALSYQIRTASGSGGTLVASGNFTSGVAANVNIAHNASGLSEGSNTLWLRVYDGTAYAPTNPSFTLLVDRSAPTVGTITQTPNPAVP